MRRCGEFVLSCAALNIVAALGIRSLQSAAVDSSGPEGLVRNAVGSLGISCESDVTGLRLGLRCASVATC